MPLFEYSKWDGSQQFLPQSADRVFDQLAEYLMQHGDRVLENLDELEDEIPEIIDLIQKEGLIEKDSEGQWRVTPRGVRRIEDRAGRPLSDLPPRCSGPPRHARRRAKEAFPGGHSALCLRRFAGESRSARDSEKRIHSPGRRCPDPGRTRRLRCSRDRVSDPVRHGRLIDMSGSMGRYGKYYTTKKVALALQAMVRAAIPKTRSR